MLSLCQLLRHSSSRQAPSPFLRLAFRLLSPSYPCLFGVLRCSIVFDVSLHRGKVHEPDLAELFECSNFDFERCVIAPRRMCGSPGILRTRLAKPKDSRAVSRPPREWCLELKQHYCSVLRKIFSIYTQRIISLADDKLLYNRYHTLTVSKRNGPSGRPSLVNKTVKNSDTSFESFYYSLRPVPLV